MGQRPAQPPALHVTSTPQHPIIRSLIEIAGADFTGAVWCDGARFYMRTALTFEERDQLLAASTEAEAISLLREPAGGRSDVLCHGDLMPMLAVLRRRGLRWLLRSLRDVTPLSLSELTDDRRLAEAELCRDDDCSGRHAWLLHHRPGDGRTYWFVWHVNLLTGLVVPPRPMELR